MLEPHEKLARLSQANHRDYLREAAEIHRAARAGGWGLRGHAAGFLRAVAGWLSPAHRAPSRGPLPRRVS